MKNLLKDKREEKGMSQNYLAEKSGVSRQTISAIENQALDNIESKTMVKLALALECDIGDIFFKENVVFAQQEIKK